MTAITDAILYSVPLENLLIYLQRALSKFRFQYLSSSEHKNKCRATSHFFKKSTHLIIKQNRTKAMSKEMSALSSTTPSSKNDDVKIITWTASQDEALKEQVRLHGPQNWPRIASAMPISRSNKQCRERWFNHLDPSIKTGPWTEEEDRTILRCLGDGMEGKWTLIAKMISGRTDNNVKNRWHYLKKRVHKYISDKGRGRLDFLKRGEHLEECLRLDRQMKNEKKPVSKTIESSFSSPSAPIRRRSRSRSKSKKSSSESPPKMRISSPRRSIEKKNVESSSRKSIETKDVIPSPRRSSLRKKVESEASDSQDLYFQIPTSRDITFGAGSSRSDTEGNHYFERILSKHRANYQQFTNFAPEKGEIIDDILEEISMDGRRFLTPHYASKDAWVEPEMLRIRDIVRKRLKSQGINTKHNEVDNDSFTSVSFSEPSTRRSSEKSSSKPSVRRSPRKLSANHAASSAVSLSFSNNQENSDSDSDYDYPLNQKRPDWLPTGWKFEMHSSYFYYSPQCEYRFRSRNEVEDFIHCLETVSSGGKKKRKGNEDDEREAYGMFRKSYSDDQWTKRVRSIGSGCGMRGGKKKRKSHPEGGEDTIASSVRPRRNNRNVPRRRYSDIEWKSSRESGAAAALQDSDFTSSQLSLSSPRLKRDASSGKKEEGSSKKEVPIGSVGYTFRKQFDAGWFTGKVVKIRPGAALNKDRRCLYEDGDEEDLSLQELKILATLDERTQQRKAPPLLRCWNNHLSPSEMTPLSNIPKPANGYEYTKKEALKIITRFPKRSQGVRSSEYSDGRDRAKAIREMIAKGWVPLAERNLYNHLANYEAGIPVSAEWHSSTRWKKGELVSNNDNSNQRRSKRNQASPNLPGNLDEYLEMGQNKRWYERFQKLKEFKRLHGTSAVFSSNTGTADANLKKWAKDMRYHCRQYVGGATQGVRVDEMRFALLQSVGFEYELVQGSSAPRSHHASCLSRKREFVPDEVLSHSPSVVIPRRKRRITRDKSLDDSQEVVLDSYAPPSTRTRKRARTSLDLGHPASTRTRESNPVDEEVILLDSLDDIPLCQTAESTLHSTFQTEGGADNNDECDSGDNSDEQEEDEWLHKVASLLTTAPSRRQSPSCVAVPDAVLSNQFESGAATGPRLRITDTDASFPASDSTRAIACVGDDQKKRNLADHIFYWICSCKTVNKYRSSECFSCGKGKNPHSRRSLMLALAEKAVKPDEVQLLHQASRRIPIADRQAVPDKVIAYLMQQKIPGVTFSTLCRRPSNDIDDYFYWICGSCTMRNSYKRANCTACLQPKSPLADDSSLLVMARDAAEKSRSVEEAINLIPTDERRAIPEVVLNGLVTCAAMIEKPRSPSQSSEDNNCNPGDSSKETEQSNGGISTIIKNFPTFLSGIHDELVNNNDWGVNCIEDAILCGENMPFPLGLNVRKFFLGYGFHDGRIVKTVRKQLFDEEAKDQRPVLVYRVVYNDGDEEDFLHHEIASLRQVFDQANVSSEAPSSVQIPIGTRFELRTGTTVTVVAHLLSCERGDRLTIQFDDSSKEAEFDLLKFQLVVLRRIHSSDLTSSNGNGCSAPLLEWPKLGRGPPNGTSEQNEYNIGEGLTLSRRVDKFAYKNDVDTCFSSSNAVNNPRDVRQGVKMRMWDPAECFKYLSYDPYAATVVSFVAFISVLSYLPFQMLTFISACLIM